MFGTKRSKESPSFWKNDIRPGKTIVSLSDEVSLTTSLQEGKGLEPKDYVVKSVKRFEDTNDLFTWVILELENGWEIIAVIVDDEMDIRLCREVSDEGFSPCNREMAIDNGWFWLFQEPEDPDNFVPSDLDYTDLLYREYQKSDEWVEYEYQSSPVGVVAGKIYYNPAQSGIDNPQFAMLHDYRADDDCPWERMTLLEQGGEDCDEGGLLTLRIGTTITLAEIEVFN